MVDIDNEKASYKETKLGLIPVDWGVVKLGDVAEIQTGIAKGKKNIQDPVSIPYLRVANVQDGYLNLNEIKLIQVPKEKIERYLLKDGDVLMTEGGDFDKLGRGTIWKCEIEVCLHQNHVFVVRTNKEKLLPYFLNAFSKTERGKRYFILCSKQSTNLASINSSQLKQFPVVLPSIIEQQKITSILSIWDKALEKLKQLIERKVEQKKGLMQRLFSSKKDWKEYTYHEILKAVKRSLDWDDEEKYDLISVRRRSGGLFHRDSLFGHQIKTKNLRTAKEGDYLISKMQILHGASGLTTKEFDGMKISGSYIALVSKDSNILDIEYMNWLSKTKRFYHQTYISSYGVHIEKMTFDFKSFLKQHVSLPCVEEQKKTVSILNLAEKEISILQRKREAFKEQKKGLMQRLLTGKIRVNL